MKKNTTNLWLLKLKINSYLREALLAKANPPSAKHIWSYRRYSDRIS